MGVPLSQEADVIIKIEDPSSVASIDVDAQYGFTPECGQELPVPDALSIVEELNRQATFASKRIGTKDAHPKEAIWVATNEHPPLSPIEGKNVDVHWPLHCVPGTKGFSLIKGLPHPSEYDFFVWKGVETDLHPYGGCYHDLHERLSTGLIEFLHQHKIQTVIIGGLATDYCVKVTALQIKRAGFRTIVNLGASRGLTPHTTQSAIHEMKKAGIIFIQSCNELTSAIIPSLLDTDLYKLTMMQCVRHQFPNTPVGYRLILRKPIDLRPYFDEIKNEIHALCQLQFTPSEIAYLQSLKIFKNDFLDYLSTFKLPENSITLDPNVPDLGLQINGTWDEIILFEVPLLAIICEIYFRQTHDHPNFEEAKRRLQQKIEFIQEEASHLAFSDFGTRRRFSHAWQKEVIETLKNQLPQQFIGTSNLYFAKLFQLKPIGTMAHEFLQACQVLAPDIKGSQQFALETWLKEYPHDLGIALTDSLTMDIFLEEFNQSLAQRYQGLRQDSGDPIQWGEKAIAHYLTLGIDPKNKLFVFSDNLNPQKAKMIDDHFRNRCTVAFGIGTNLTNDFGIEKLDIVLKMIHTRHQPVLKITDSPGKTVCEDEAYLMKVKEKFNIKDLA